MLSIKGLLNIIITVLVLITAIPGIDQTKKYVEGRFFSNMSFKNDFEHKVFILVKISFWNAILLLWLIFMVIVCRNLDKRPSPLRRADSARINLLNQQIRECQWNLLMFLIVFGFRLFMFVRTDQEMKDLYQLAYSWFIFRVVSVLACFVSRTLEASSLRLIGSAHSALVLLNSGVLMLK